MESIIVLTLFVLVGGAFIPDPRITPLGGRLFVGMLIIGALTVAWIALIQAIVKLGGVLPALSLGLLLMYASARITRMTYP